MVFTLNINKSKYELLFKENKKDNLKNFIIEYIKNGSPKREKKVVSAKNNIKIEKVTKILSVRYSTQSGSKVDITNVIFNYLNINSIGNTKVKENTDLITSLSKCFNKFLHKYISFFCGRCEGIGHHKGIINTYLQSILKYDIQMIERFFNDVEHGFFHGLMASFICFIINQDSNLVDKSENLEQIFISATMHDFLKANGVPQKEHDKRLKELYPKLCEETYVHSDPPEKYFKKHLIIADRLELRRYPDYDSWVDDRFHELYRTMKTDTKKMLDLFYTSYRPALEYIFKNRDSVFVRHGTEVYQKQIEPFFPPSKTTYYDGLNEYYPIEIDSVPFCSVINNDLIEGNKWFNDNQNGHCSNHDGNAQWNIIKGYISIEDFKNDAKIKNNGQRDHLFAKSNIDITKWVFLYQNLDKCFHMNNATCEPNFIESRMGIDPFEYLSKLMDSNNKIVSQESVFLLFQFFRMFKCRIVVLR